MRWVAAFDFPDVERDYEFVALRHTDEYPFNEGRIVSSRGLDITAGEYEDHFEETHVERSTALHSHLRERGAYLVGPLARYSLNFDRLSRLAQEVARDVGLGPKCSNPYRSIVVRAVEVLYACLLYTSQSKTRFFSAEPTSIRIIGRGARTPSSSP